MSTPNFSIEFLDHVAIVVADMQRSVTWYQEVLGLKVFNHQAWGEFPIFMLRENFGVALFPATSNDVKLTRQALPKTRIDHFAFRVTNENFATAKEYFASINIPFKVQDHQIFHFIYLKDPDNNTVELTTPTLE